MKRFYSNRSLSKCECVLPGYGREALKFGAKAWIIQMADGAVIAIAACSYEVREGALHFYGHRGYGSVSCTAARCRAQPRTSFAAGKWVSVSQATRRGEVGFFGVWYKASGAASEDKKRNVIDRIADSLEEISDKE